MVITGSSAFQVSCCVKCSLSPVRVEMQIANISSDTFRADSHFDIRISISRHTQTQYDVDNKRLLLEIFLLIKSANYLHLTASAYVGLCLCLCQSVNQP